MISAIALLTHSGDIIALRVYRKDFDEQAFEEYRMTIIAAKEVNTPIDLIQNTSFLNHYENEVYYVASTRFNPNAGTILTILSQLPKLFKTVLEINPPEPNRLKFAIPSILELLDELIDSGYPQNSDPNTLQILTQREALYKTVLPSNKITIQATNQVSHRATGIVYQKNELFDDVIERVNLLCSNSGKVLDSSVNGTIALKSQLSGMTECKIGFNDKISVESDANEGSLRTSTSIEVDDMIFHQCVKLSNFATERAISFIPPDGQFDLMQYRKIENIKLPFTITPLVRDLNQNSIEIRINVQAL
jgi:AP-2 complex subunit mu-1